MSKERTDEFLKWRGVLDQPGAGLGQVLPEREATWQKLADRLGDRRRNRLSGYRIAAACLLFALMIPAFRMLQDRRHATSGRAPVHHADLLPSNRGRSAGPGNGPTASTAVRRQQAASLPTDPLRPSPTDRPGYSRLADAAALPADRPGPPRQGQESRWSARTVKSPASKTDRAPLAALVSIGSPPATIVAPPPDPASQIALLQSSGSSREPVSGMSPSQRTKQMRVVHQNEIRGGNTSSPAVGVTRPGRLLNALFGPNPPPSSSVPSPPEDPALLKIKLSPSN